MDFDLSEEQTLLKDSIDRLLAVSTTGAALEIEVLLIEALGADTVVHGRVAGDEAMLTVRLAGTAAVAEGDRLGVVPDPARLHLFDAGDGRRLTI